VNLQSLPGGSRRQICIEGEWKPFHDKKEQISPKKDLHSSQPPLQPFPNPGILLNNKQRLPRIMTLPRKVTVPS
jgi:hypothetical protein